MIIATSHLSKRYGDHVALDDLTLEVREGEIFGYLGPNGSGKTTTIRLLLGFIWPSAGTARVLGKDAWSDNQSIHRDVGYVPGEVRLYDHLTGEESLEMLRRLRGLDSLSIGADLARRLDLDLSRRIRAYSRGMKQKLGLIQALMHSPKLIILDEPTTGLDPIMQHELYELLKERRAQGATIFFSSHVLSEVEKICDRVGILRRGKLVALEAVDDLSQRKLRRVEVVFRDGTRIPENLALGNATLTSRNGRHCSFIVSGHVDAFIKQLATFELEDLIIERPGLEEVFYELYEDDP